MSTTAVGNLQLLPAANLLLETVHKTACIVICSILHTSYGIYGSFCLRFHIVALCLTDLPGSRAFLLVATLLGLQH